MDKRRTACGPISRRSLLRRIPIAAGVAVLFGRMRAALAQSKMTHAQALYQDTPKNGQECSTCLQFQPPNACAIVESPISPKGWCQFYGPKT